MEAIKLAYMEAKTNKLVNGAEISVGAIETRLKETYGNNVTVDENLNVIIEESRTYKINSDGSVTKNTGHIHTEECYCIDCEGDGKNSYICEGEVECGYQSNTSDFWHFCLSCGDSYYCYMQDYCVGIPACANEIEEECPFCIGGLICEY